MRIENINNSDNFLENIWITICSVWNLKDKWIRTTNNTEGN